MGIGSDVVPVLKHAPPHKMSAAHALTAISSDKPNAVMLRSDVMSLPVCRTYQRERT